MSLYQHLKREKEVVDYVSATSLFLYTIKVASKDNLKEGVRKEFRRDRTHYRSRPSSYLLPVERSGRQL